MSHLSGYEHLVMNRRVANDPEAFIVWVDGAICGEHLADVRGSGSTDCSIKIRKLHFMPIRECWCEWVRQLCS